MSMEHWWNDTVRVKQICAGRNHFVYQIPIWTALGSDIVPSRWGQRLPPKLWNCPLVYSLNVGCWILSKTFCRELRIWGMWFFICWKRAVLNDCSYRLSQYVSPGPNWRYAGVNWSLYKIFSFLSYPWFHILYRSIPNQSLTERYRDGALPRHFFFFLLALGG